MFTKLGGLTRISGVQERYIDDLVKDGPLQNRLKLVVACGNGTPAAFAPQAFERLGCEVVALDTQLDHQFPRYNPNPESAVMLDHMAQVVRETRADLAIGFDGDGDRLGVIDEKGQAIHADIMGLMIARDLARLHKNAEFVVDVKSTGLFNVDPVLNAQGAKTHYWKTGHSYIKRHVHKLGALVGFEKSGHFFFNKPLGRGYDDGLVAAIAVLRMLDRAAPGPCHNCGPIYQLLMGHCRAHLIVPMKKNMLWLKKFLRNIGSY